MSTTRNYCVLENGRSTCASDKSKCQTCADDEDEEEVERQKRKQAKREFRRQVKEQKENLEKMVASLECQLCGVSERNRVLKAKIERFQYPHGRCRSSPDAPCGSGSWNTYPVEVDRLLGHYAQTVRSLSNQVGKLRCVVSGLDEQMRLAGIQRIRCKTSCTKACKTSQCPELGDCECEKLAWNIIEAVKELNTLMESCKLDKRMMDLKDLFKDLKTLQ